MEIQVMKFLQTHFTEAEHSNTLTWLFSPTKGTTSFWNETNLRGRRRFSIELTFIGIKADKALSAINPGQRTIAWTICAKAVLSWDTSHPPPFAKIHKSPH